MLKNGHPLTGRECQYTGIEEKERRKKELLERRGQVNGARPEREIQCGLWSQFLTVIFADTRRQRG